MNHSDHCSSFNTRQIRMFIAGKGAKYLPTIYFNHESNKKDSDINECLLFEVQSFIR
jgi:hypothetical protein